MSIAFCEKSAIDSLENVIHLKSASKGSLVIGFWFFFSEKCLCNTVAIAVLAIIDGFPENIFCFNSSALRNFSQVKVTIVI